MRTDRIALIEEMKAVRGCLRRTWNTLLVSIVLLSTFLTAFSESVFGCRNRMAKNLAILSAKKLTLWKLEFQRPRPTRHTSFTRGKKFENRAFSQFENCKTEKRKRNRSTSRIREVSVCYSIWRALNIYGITKTGNQRAKSLEFWISQRPSSAFKGIREWPDLESKAQILKTMNKNFANSGNWWTRKSERGSVLTSRLIRNFSLAF